MDHTFFVRRFQCLGHLFGYIECVLNGAGAVLTGNPLTAVERGQIRKIVLFVEGYDSIQPQGIIQLFQAESEVLVRNAAL